jgi:hypothetical protein
LLDYLAVHLSDSGYDLKKTIELICTSEAYQSQTPVSNASSQAIVNVFRGPTARRMTAEQFMDTVWQVTNAAPMRFDAAVLRFKHPESKSIVVSNTKPNGQWIWSHAEAAKGAPAGETITVRKKLELKPIPNRAVAAVSCDNQLTLYVNGKLVLSDDNWETVDVVNLQPHLKEGTNELLIVAKNGGTDPNPAGLLFEARLIGPQGSVQTIGTDAGWQWTKAQPDARGRFAKQEKQEPDWQPVAVIPNADLWNKSIGGQFVGLLSAAAASDAPMVRASLMKNDAFMTALGRPTRDQIVSMRPSELTTLEAIDLANGQTLADAIARGAAQLVERFKLKESGGTQSFVKWLFAFTLSREPTTDEFEVAQEVLGADPTPEKVEDLLWSMFMLPEYQLVR